jgi:hypothetical protein
MADGRWPVAGGRGRVAAGSRQVAGGSGSGSQWQWQVWQRWEVAGGGARRSSEWAPAAAPAAAIWRRRASPCWKATDRVVGRAALPHAARCAHGVLAGRHNFNISTYYMALHYIGAELLGSEQRVGAARPPPPARAADQLHFLSGPQSHFALCVWPRFALRGSACQKKPRNLEISNLEFEFSGVAAEGERRNDLPLVGTKALGRPI